MTLEQKYGVIKAPSTRPNHRPKSPVISTPRPFMRSAATPRYYTTASYMVKLGARL